MGMVKDPTYCILTAVNAASTVGAVNSNKYPAFWIRDPIRKYCISFCSREPSPFNRRNNANTITLIPKMLSPINKIFITLYHQTKYYNPSWMMAIAIISVPIGSVYKKPKNIVYLSACFCRIASKASNSSSL